MSPVSAKKLGNKSVRKSKHTGGTRITHVALRFTIHPEEKREKYVELSDRMIERVQKIINSILTG